MTVSNELMSESTVLLNTLQDDNLEFTISPNPASTKLNIRLPKGLQNAQVSIFDVLGKKVYSQELNSLTASIDVSKWNSGVYLVKVSTDTFKQTRRFVKQ
ncbi:T9SS type A sorting domain-containing protein [Mangrovimonas sp. YM274]|uniref:T9SS type A sorting domain-containing protein n=1 Tax=Mangrovimonas sp. YM274 TaxID=3070660 RepID=UPI0027DB6302|nr:T9SS type A sorting domain-containing protein [Mangrovimonas sp. YM274]WMI69947.1 T9SS type A sorting domain-containing protein [Mangrovimonas sp. YM274]